MATLLTHAQELAAKAAAEGSIYRVIKQVDAGTFLHIIKSTKTDVWFMPIDGSAGQYRRTL